MDSKGGNVKEYELTVLVHPDLEADLDKALGKVRALITDNGGEITKEDNWGKKRLAYSIKREDFAVYVYFEVKLPAPRNTINKTRLILLLAILTTPTTSHRKTKTRNTLTACRRALFDVTRQISH